VRISKRIGVASFLILFVPLLIMGAAAVAQTLVLPGTVPSFNQAYTDGPGGWGDCPLGANGCPDQVATTGCLVTAFASVLAYHGITVYVSAEDSCTGRSRSGMDPGLLNDWLRTNAGYGRCARDPLGDCCLIWERLPGVELTFHSNRSDVGLNPVASVVIDHALRQGNPVIAGVHWGTYCHGSTQQTEDCHWVVLTGKKEESYSIIDPYNPDPTSPYGIRTTLAAGVHGRYVIDRFVVVKKAPDFVSIASPDTSDLLTLRREQPTGASVLVLVVALAFIAAVIVVASALGGEGG